MEAYYDAQSDSENGKSEETDTKVSLSPEIENFLSELGQSMENEE